MRRAGGVLSYYCSFTCQKDRTTRGNIRLPFSSWSIQGKNVWWLPDSVLYLKFTNRSSVLILAYLVWNICVLLLLVVLLLVLILLTVQVLNRRIQHCLSVDKTIYTWRVAQDWLKQIKQLEGWGWRAIEIYALKTSRDSVLVSSSGSWFQTGKRDSLKTFVLKNRFSTCTDAPLLQHPGFQWRCGVVGMATMEWNVEHHCYLGLLSSVLEAFPSQVTDHGCDTAGIAIVASHESRAPWKFVIPYRAPLLYMYLGRNILLQMSLIANRFLSPGWKTVVF